MKQNDARFRRIKAILVVCVLLPGVLLLLLGLRGHSIAVPLTSFRIDGSLVTTMGVGISILSALSIFLPVRWVAANFVSLYMALGVLSLGQFRSADKPHKLISVAEPTKVVVTKTEWIGDLYANHERYGSQHRPNVKVQHVTTDFKVEYTTDADGWRNIPTLTMPKANRPVAFVGCSITFGQGVNDDETFSAILAREAWPHHRVINRSRSGWGTRQAFVVVEDLLAEQEKPVCIFYGWFTLHHKRNYLRQSWFGPNPTVNSPFFELEGDKVVRQGFKLGSEAILADSDELKKKEFAISLALIEGMSRLCKEKEVPFVVLHLANRHIDPVWEALAGRSDIATIDVSRFCDETHPNDHHPTPLGHRWIANAIASDPVLADLKGAESLYTPTGIQTPVPDYKRLHLGVIPEAGSYGKLISLPDEPYAVRVEPHTAGTNPFGVTLARRSLPITKRRQYEFRFEARADEPRTLAAGVTQGREPWKGLGCSVQIDLTTQWQSFSFPFIANANEEDAQVAFQVGSSNVPIELRNVLILSDSKELEPVPPMPTGRRSAPGHRPPSFAPNHRNDERSATSRPLSACVTALLL